MAPAVTRYDARGTLGLPAPLRRSFRAVLVEGQPIILAAGVERAGTFDTGQTVDQWRPLTSHQRVTTHPSGFVWDGRIALVPDVPAQVYDAYLCGEGNLHPSVLGLVAMGGLEGAGTIAQGELLRVLAEAPWFPTALLPSQGPPGRRWTTARPRRP